MKRIAASALAGLMMAVSLAPMTTPASAQVDVRVERERYVGSWCDRHPRDRDCYDWRESRDRWDDDQYRRWYRRHHRDNDSGAAALFGLATGALLGATVAPGLSGGGRDVSDHVARCQARYRSYDPSSDTFLGYDGYRHRCRL